MNNPRRKPGAKDMTVKKGFSPSLIKKSKIKKWNFKYSDRRKLPSPDFDLPTFLT